MRQINSAIRQTGTLTTGQFNVPPLLHRIDAFRRRAARGADRSADARSAGCGSGREVPVIRFLFDSTGKIVGTGMGPKSTAPAPDGGE